MNFDKDEVHVYFLFIIFLIVQKANRILVLSKLSFTIKRWFLKYRLILFLKSITGD